ncbi:hypothetical protein LXL04_007453 [Taraxacum kok-saghyz]
MKHHIMFLIHLISRKHNVTSLIHLISGIHNQKPVMKKKQKTTKIKKSPVMKLHLNHNRSPKGIILKGWTEAEEVALVKAFIQCSLDDNRGNEKERTTFWEDILEHFCTQIRGSDHLRHQLNSKWKDL